MSYILIEKTACEIFVRDRFYQNLGFLPARNFVSFFRGKDEFLPGLTTTKYKYGKIISTNENNQNKDALIFDLKTLTLESDCTDAELIITIQKVMRFAVKYWESLAFSSGERIIKGSTKALVFPFPYVANRMGYRVTIEREPNAKRLANRTSAKYLLAYKSGTSEGEGANEQASLTTFRVAYDDHIYFLDSKRTNISQEGVRNCFVSLGVTDLNNDALSLHADQGFDQWNNLLTDDQKKFVTSDFSVPHRLQGPAGTGKTLCLVLKAISVLKRSEVDELAHRSIFIAPSEEVAEIIRNRIIGNGGSDFITDSNEPTTSNPRKIEVLTLQRLCANILNYQIDESEFLDRDSVESKNVQLLYLDQIASIIKSDELKSVKSFLSADLSNFLSNEDSWVLAQLLQHEIATVIKGRANGKLETYKDVPPLDYGLPVRGERDKEYIYKKFQDYQSKLELANQYDVDDVVISAIGQLDTPIWRRRRQQLGYDSIYVDEVHLFNLNEISVLHYLSKSVLNIPISYSIDRTQSIGDIGWSDGDLSEAIGGINSPISGNKVSAVFRSSPDIVDLAFFVTSSGANLFTNFENPIKMSEGTFTAEDERKCAKPCLSYVDSDDLLPSAVYKCADEMAKSLSASRDSILVVVFDEQLLTMINSEWRTSNKGFKQLTRRGDFSTIHAASKAGCLLLSPPELVGGLEFQGVVLVGCDKGRLPPNSGNSDCSRAYLNYKSYNNLYVSITRSKYRIEFILNSNRGLSDILSGAIASELLVTC